MAKSPRTKKRTSIKYFFLNGHHHKVIRISRSEDIITAWNYVEKKRCSYIWSVARKSMVRAFTVKEVANIFQRDRLVIHHYISSGKIKKPAVASPIDKDSTRPGKYLFSEDDVRDLHSYLLTVHRGRPRNDGEITNSKLMSRAELEAVMKENTILYTKTSSGEFVPVWEQPDW